MTSTNHSAAIVLCGGSINYSSLPIATNASNSMIPVNGKPVIGWILDDLLLKDITRVIVVLQFKNKRLFDFISWAYRGRLSLEFAFSPEGGSIIDSLASGLRLLNESPGVHVLLGDTLLKDPFEKDGDYVYTAEVSDSRKWCMIKTDSHGVITDYYDKIKTHEEGLKAIAGYYFFSDTYLLKQAVDEALHQHRQQVSDLMSIYGKYRPFHVKDAKQWYDFGNIENFMKSKRQLLQTRFFNSLQIDGLLSVIVKRSEFTEKLHHELNWYRSLPDELKVLSPRLLQESAEGKSVVITQEYYGYPNMAEIFLFGDLHVDIWYDAVDRLLNVHELFRNYKTGPDSNALKSIYIDKTFQRVEELCNSDPKWSEVLGRKTICIDDTDYSNFYELTSKIEAFAEGLASNGELTIIHGDFCFSNILYDVSNQIVRLIDPRGSFGKPGIWGDPRYDMAKLRHSVCGLYDYIVADLFEVTGTDDKFSLNICTNDVQGEVAVYLDNKMIEKGYDLSEIKFIEGLLFISMLPLHSGHPKRQLVMYLNGIKLLNEVLL